MTPAELRKLIDRGESDTLELKSRVPPFDQLAKTLASFANVRGGVVVCGVREPAQVVGVDEHQMRTAFQRIQNALAGKVVLSLDIVDFDGRSVGVITVQRATGLIAAGGAYYARVGETVRALTAQEIREQVTALQSPDSALTDLSRAVASSTQVIEQLRQDFRKANSPWRRAIWAVVGAVAGAVFKGLIDYYWSTR